MRKLYNPKNFSTVAKVAKQMSVEHNVTINVIDSLTGKVVQSHEGHNAATNSLLIGIAHYLVGDGVYNQAYDMLSRYIPRYMSIGTMGLFTQASDENGLPIGLGADTDAINKYDDQGHPIDASGNRYYGDPQTERLCHYIAQCPGFGADGYDSANNNDRPYFGLGPKYVDRDFSETISCELIGDSYPRSAIAFRDIVPEVEAEIPKTIDIIYSAMISTGALAQFRGDNDYLFITEAGLWSNKNWKSGGENGLLAGYRIVPPNRDNWDVGTYVDGHYEEQYYNFVDDSNNSLITDEGDSLITGRSEEDMEDIYIPSHYDLDPTDPEKAATQQANQELLRKNILRVNKNQVVQVIWKIQIGGLEQLGDIKELYPSLNTDLMWNFWDD